MVYPGWVNCCCDAKKNFLVKSSDLEICSFHKDRYSCLPLLIPGCLAEPMTKPSSLSASVDIFGFRRDPFDALWFLSGDDEAFVTCFGEFKMFICVWLMSYYADSWFPSNLGIMLFCFMLGELGEAQPLLISLVPKASFSNSILIFASSSFSVYWNYSSLIIYCSHAFAKIYSVSTFPIPIDMSSSIILEEFSFIFSETSIFDSFCMLLRISLPSYSFRCYVLNSSLLLSSCKTLILLFFSNSSFGFERSISSTLSNYVISKDCFCVMGFVFLLFLNICVLGCWLLVMAWELLVELGHLYWFSLMFNSIPVATQLTCYSDANCCQLL